MFGLALGRLGTTGSRQWSESALWPAGASSPGLWIDPSYSASQWQDSAGTTPLSTVGTVLDSSNPVGLILDRKGGATVKTDAGIHLSQSTSAARPVASARVNLLTKTEDFSAWELLVGASAVGTTITLPAGSVCSKYFAAPTNTDFAQRCIVTGSGTVVVSIMTHGYSSLASQTIVLSASPQIVVLTASTAGNTVVGTLFTSTAGATVTSLETQLNLGPTATPYQRVNTASDYTASGFPQYLKFDGVDDALASATFAAGTLTSSMDCLIAVRRDSTALAMLGLYESKGGSKFFGITESGGSFSHSSGCGSPTVWVDGIQLSGGTSVTRGTIYTALTHGTWHILEMRGLNLSLWVSVAFGDGYSGHQVNGALGKIELFDSGQDANRDKARARMAAYFGVTLP